MGREKEELRFPYGEAFLERTEAGATSSSLLEDSTWLEESSADELADDSDEKVSRWRGMPACSLLAEGCDEIESSWEEVERFWLSRDLDALRLTLLRKSGRMTFESGD